MINVRIGDGKADAVGVADVEVACAAPLVGLGVGGALLLGVAIDTRHAGRRTKNSRVRAGTESSKRQN